MPPENLKMHEQKGTILSVTILRCSFLCFAKTPSVRETLRIRKIVLRKNSICAQSRNDR